MSKCDICITKDPVVMFSCFECGNNVILCGECDELDINLCKNCYINYNRDKKLKKLLNE